MKKEDIITYSAALFVVAIMTGASELSGEKEIIFPEITAIAVGAIVAPRQVWQTNKIRIFGLVSICAMLGVSIVHFIPLPFFWQLILAFSASQIIYLYSKTTFAPLICAVMLPVLLQEKSLVYPVSAMALTGIILTALIILEKTGIKTSAEYTSVPSPEKSDLLNMLKRILLMAIVTAAAVISGFKFIIAPPILVAFTEFSKKGNGAVKKPVKTVLLITLCAASGALCRYIITVTLGLPLTLSAIAATLIMLTLLRKFQLFLPPAGALTILPMLIPEAQVLLYPLQILAGVSIFMILARIFFKSQV